MAKKKKVTDQSNNLNLTVVALVALVAIVGLVALVLQSANLAAVPTGVQQAVAEENVAGQGFGDYSFNEEHRIVYDGWGAGGSNDVCSCSTDPECLNCGNLIKTNKCIASC